MEIIVNLSENVYQSFKRLADKTSRDVSEVVADKIQSDYWTENLDDKQDITDLSDADILELANLKLSTQQDRRLSKLLANQRESRITTGEKVELEGLMGLYRMSNFRKAQAGAEAVRRGLIKTSDDLK